MKIAFFSTQNYEKQYFDQANQGQHEFVFFVETLSTKTADKAQGCEAICCFVTDCLDASVIAKLAEIKVQLIALRSAGYDHVDLNAAKKHHLTVVRVPKYSPQAVAEFAVTLILTLNRKILQAHQQGLKYNFSLEGLMGFNLYQKTVGIIGTGNIGTAFAQIMNGFGCRLLAHDPIPNEACRKLNVNYVGLRELLNKSDIISLHCLLNEKTHHLLDTKEFAQMKKGAMLINTGRGLLVNTAALLAALESKQVGYAGLDVYEKEKGLFFINHQNKIIQNEQFLKLQKLPNVIITPHQAFFTHEAVENIAKTTIENITAFEKRSTINKI